MFSNVVPFMFTHIHVWRNVFFDIQEDVVYGGEKTKRLNNVVRRHVPVCDTTKTSAGGVVLEDFIRIDMCSEIL